MAGRLPGVRNNAETWDFLDAAQIPTFAQDAVAADFEQPQLIRRVFGADLTRLEPQAPVSRTEAATALLVWGLDNQPLLAESPVIAPADAIDAEEPTDTTASDLELVPNRESTPDSGLPSDLEGDPDAIATPPTSEDARGESSPPRSDGGFITPRD
ncbi:MAG: hypothetical protein HC926_01690 [Synechococcaceae cyanobacterium SM2_3_60]|nr:hypothetical protein [Synechococcaceae cyanobacterium SM2_3_60]